MRQTVTTITVTNMEGLPRRFYELLREAGRVKYDEKKIDIKRPAPPPVTKNDLYWWTRTDFPTILFFNVMKRYSLIKDEVNRIWARVYKDTIYFFIQKGKKSGTYIAVSKDVFDERYWKSGGTLSETLNDLTTNGKFAVDEITTSLSLKNALKRMNWDGKSTLAGG